MSAWATLAMVMGGVLAGLYALAVWWTSRLILRPARMTDGKATYVLGRVTPADLGLAYEEAAFDVEVGPGDPERDRGGRLRIAGWWIPAGGSDRTVVLLHGYGDAKIGAVAWAPMLRKAGWNVLAIDLRAHGESGGTLCTGGVWEAEDVRQVIDAAMGSRPDRTRRLAVLGISLGAVTAAAVAARRGDIEALVLDSPVSDFGTAAAAQVELLGLVGAWVWKPALALARRAARADWDSVNPVRTIGKVSGRVMLVLPGDDPFVSQAGRAEMTQAVRALGGRGVVWEVPDATHALAYAAMSEMYEQTVTRFLDGATVEGQNDPEAPAAG